MAKQTTTARTRRAAPKTERRMVAHGDTTVRRYRAGDPILDPDGKPYIDLTAAHGLTMGAIRQLAAIDDSLRARTAALEDRVQALEVRLARAPAR